MHRRRQSALAFALVLLVSFFGKSAKAFDSSDAEPPSITFSRVISQATKSSEMIVVEISTRDDKNWVSIKPRMSRFEYTFDNVTLPICNVKASLDFQVEEMARESLASGEKKQTFWLTFFSPRAIAPSGCPPYDAANIRIFTALCVDPFLEADACMDVRDEVGRESTGVVWSKYLPGRRVTSSPLYSQIFLDSSFRRICVADLYGRSLLGLDASKAMRDISSYLDVLKEYESLRPVSDLAFKSTTGATYSGVEMRDQLTRAKADYESLANFQRSPTIANFSKLRVCSAASESELLQYGRTEVLIAEWGTRYLTDVLQKISQARAKVEADARAKAEGEAQAKAAADAAAAAAAKANAVKKSTITCVKGKVIKKVTATKPVCPKGYKKR